MPLLLTKTQAIDECSSPILSKRFALCRQPAAIQVIKRPIVVFVEFARTAGVIASLEGAIHYRYSDAILTGVQGEQWATQRDKFEQRYTPTDKTNVGENGFYVKKPMATWAIQLTEHIAVPVGWKDDLLYGKPGHWLLQYEQGDFGVVQADIFTTCFVARYI